MYLWAQEKNLENHHADFLEYFEDNHGSKLDSHILAMNDNDFAIDFSYYFERKNLFDIFLRKLVQYEHVDQRT